MMILKMVFKVIWMIAKWPLKLVGIILNAIIEVVGNFTLRSGLGDIRPFAIVKLFAPLTRMLAQL